MVKKSDWLRGNRGSEGKEHLSYRDLNMSGHIAYHMEAQRRQRVLDKQHAALERMKRKKVSESKSHVMCFGNKS